MTSLALALRPTAAAMARSQISRALALLRSPKAVYWRDPSDLSTLFQDSAGTTPVTAVEQPVGLVLDKKTAGQLGSELVTNGNFASGNTGWIRSLPSWDGTSGVMANDGTNGVAANVRQDAVITAGKTYRITFDFARTSGSLNLWLNGSQLVQSGINTAGAKTFTVSATVSGSLFFEATASSVLSIDNISVREIPGVHFIQATPASRLTLSSRYNLLTKTEQFDDAHWLNSIGGTGVAPVRVANDAIAPDGTLTADRLTFNAPSGAGNMSLIGSTFVSGLVTGASYTVSLYVKAATVGDVGKTILYRTVAGAGYITHVLTADYQRISRTSAAASSSADGLTFGLRPELGGSSGSVSVHVWGAQLDVGSDVLPYQRVNTATDYDFDFAKFPPYLRYDGIDDSQASAATVDLTGTDKITVVGAWHKASDAAVGLALEHSAAVTGNNGSFYLGLPISAGVANAQFASKGTSIDSVTKTAFSAPVSSVISAQANIGGDSISMRINGASAGSSNFDQGTGNFGNHTLFVGSRAGSSLRFNGREYGHALFNTTLSASELAAVEAYFRSKSRAY